MKRRAITPEEVGEMMPLAIDGDNDMVDSRGYIVAEFRCPTWMQEHIVAEANSAADLRAVSFDELCNKAARDLPPDFDIEVRLERGAGAVVLLNTAREEIDFGFFDDDPIHVQFQAALAKAIELKGTDHA